MTYRDKLVVDRAAYEARIKELREQMGKDLQNTITTSTENMIGILSGVRSKSWKRLLRN